MSWLSPEDLPIGLGCMRLSRADDPGGEGARTTLAAALAAGVTVFDTARAYGPGAEDAGHNERLVAAALAGTPARIVTKGGMRREGASWIPDGRAVAIRRDCEASLEALDGRVDLWLLHAPDPRVPWATSVRALAALVSDGLVKHVGVCNVNRRQLDEALDAAPIAAVQVALGAYDDEALRGGVVERCAELRIVVLAHSPFGGPKRAGKLAHDGGLAKVAERHGVTAAEVVLAALRAIDPCVVPLPGACRPQTARGAAAAARLVLAPEDRAAIEGRLPSFGRASAPRAAVATADGEVVLVMGLPGAGKSEAARELVASGHERLNRDERGGSLRGLAQALDARLTAGVRRVVLDNTYTTRAARRDALEIAARHRLPVRGVWIDVPVAQAQVNVVLRMLEAHGRLLAPDELARGKDNTALAPTAIFRMLRAVEPPADDEGFASLEVRPFVRRPGTGRPARLVAAEAAPDAAAARRHAAGELALLFAWRPEGRSADLEAIATATGMRLGVCAHGGGPPRCWCRPPLPGMLLAFARVQGVDLAASVLIGTSATHRSMAAAVGARFEKG